jgi:hypothetical protein
MEVIESGFSILMFADGCCRLKTLPAITFIVIHKSVIENSQNLILKISIRHEVKNGDRLLMAIWLSSHICLRNT